MRIFQAPFEARFKKNLSIFELQIEKNNAYQKNIYWHDFKSESFIYILYFLIVYCFLSLKFFLNHFLSIFTISQFLEIYKVSCGSWYFTKIPVTIFSYRFTIISWVFSLLFVRTYIKAIFETHTPSLTVVGSITEFIIFTPTLIYWHPSYILKFRIFQAPPNYCRPPQH